MIQVSHLGFRYQRDPVLSDVSFEVRTGEILGIIGPNGSGKSSTLKILSGLLRSYTGSVRLSGRDLRSYSQRELAQRVAVVPQETFVLFPFTALEVVLMGRAPYLGALELEKSEDLKLARWAMERTDTLQFASRSLQELSGGEKQRVILARALAQQAPLLLLDEPTTHLDIRHQLHVCRLLRDVNRERQLTIAVVFHDLNLASTYCDRLLLLTEGRVFRIGSPREVVTYANIKAAYEAEVYVGINDLTGLPFYMPMEDPSGGT